jgi:hypothetical protein
LAQFLGPPLVSENHPKGFAQISLEHCAILPASSINGTGTIGGVLTLALNRQNGIIGFKWMLKTGIHPNF